MVLTLTYSDLSNAIKNSNGLADKLNDYCDSLSKRVQDEMYDVEGGMSSALNNADYYVKAKIKSLKIKETNAIDLSKKTQTLLDTAKRVDGDVKNMIEAEQKAFFEKNPDMKASNLKLGLTALWCGAKDLPIYGNIIKGAETVMGALSTLKKNIKHWWECGGGKELVLNSLDAVVKIGLAVAAVVAAIVAVTSASTVAAIVVAIAACVVAVIAVVNAATNLVTSGLAIAAGGKNPAMAKIYGKQDTYSQVLRETNFHNSFLNKASNVSATIIDIADTVASVIVIVNSLAKIGGKILTNSGIGFAFKELGRDPQGKLVKKVTFKSVCKGTKALILNKPLTGKTSQGLRTTAWKNICGVAGKDISKNITALKNIGRNPGAWLSGNASSLKNDFTSLFKQNVSSSEKLKNLTKLVAISNGAVGNIDIAVKGMAKVDNKGLAYRFLGKYSGKYLLKNDIANFSNTLGLSSIIASSDSSDIIKDFTGSKDGLLQKVGNIRKKYKDFKEDNPKFDFVKEGTEFINDGFEFYEDIKSNVYGLGAAGFKRINIKGLINDGATGFISEGFAGFVNGFNISEKLKVPSFKERYPYFEYTEEAYSVS